MAINKYPSFQNATAPLQFKMAGTFDLVNPYTANPSYTFITVNVAYPGYPYFVIGQARGEIGSLAAGTRMDLNFIANTNGIVDGVGLGGDNTTAFTVTNYMYAGPYYGSSTFYVRAQRAYGAGTTGRTAYNCVAQYAVLPA